MQTIPLRAGAANAHQRFSVQLGDNAIDFRLDYISYLEYPAWTMSLFRDGSPLVSGAMLEPGCDVIQGYRAGIGQLVFTGAEVTLDNLGVDNALVLTASLSLRSSAGAINSALCSRSTSPPVTLSRLLTSRFTTWPKPRLSLASRLSCCALATTTTWTQYLPDSSPTC